MIDKIVEFSVKHRIAVCIMVAVLIGWGFYSYKNLPVDAVPDISNKMVQVIVRAPNLSPLETEKMLTTPVELIMSTIPGLEDVRSTSRFGMSEVKLIFNDDVDIYWARQQVAERISEVEEELPKEYGKPQMMPVTTGLGEIYQYTVSPKNPNDTSYSLMELRTIQDWIIRKKLMGVEGIAEISSFGGFKKEFQAQIKLECLKALNVTMDEIFTALEQGNGNTGGAYIEKDNRAFLIRGIGLVTDLNDIAQIVIKTTNGVPILIKDVADVKIGSAIRYGAMVIDGKSEAVGGIVMMQLGYNPSQVIDKLKPRIDEIQKELPSGLEIKPFIDREHLVTKTISTVFKNLLEGAIIVIFILILFLGDFRASVIVASLIPLSLLFAFGMMKQFGVVGNLMSLGALDFGLIIDGSIIVVESIAIIVSLKLRKLSVAMPYNERQDMVIHAMKEVKKSVVFGSLIILIVYMPLLSLNGIEGKTFHPLCLTVSFAIIGALILSLTYVPMMCAWILNKPHKENSFAERFVNRLFKAFTPLLSLSMRYKFVVISAVVVLLITSLFVFTRLGGEFMPRLDESSLAIETKLPVSTSLTQTILTTKNLQKAMLDSFPDEIETIVGKIGTSEVPTDPMPLEACDMIVKLYDKSHWKKVKDKQELSNRIAKIYEQTPGLELSIQQPIEMRFNEILSGARTDVVITIYGYDLDKLNAMGNQIMGILRTIPGTADIQMGRIFGLNQVKIEYDRKNMALYGITVSQINDLIETSFAGKKSGTVYEKDRKFDLVVRLPNENRNKIEEIGNLVIKNNQGNFIPLREVSNISVDVGPTEIRHLNKQRCLNIGLNVRGTDMETMVKIADKKIKEQVILPFGYTLSFGGQYENLTRAKERLSLLVPLALLIIVGLIYVAFGNFKDCLLIFTAVPLSAVGGILALYFRDITFSISAGVGFIALFGVAVLNGIMLISHFKLIEERGVKDRHRVVLIGITEKFRAVLMTSAVAALGFIPMAVSSGAGSEVQKPLATVVIGGLILSTFLTLIILPILYILFTKKKLKKANKVIVLIVLAFAGLLNAPKLEAQTSISVEKALELALKQHPALQNAQLEISKQKSLLPASFNFRNPELIFEAPTSNEFRPGVMMSFDFPTVYSHRYSAQKNRVELAEKSFRINKNELIYNVYSVYNELQFLYAKERILTKQDSQFSAIIEINEIRYNVGQISNLDKLNGEAHYKTIKNQLLQLRAELNSLSLELNRWIGNKSDTLFVPEHKFEQLKQIRLYSLNDSVTNNPFNDYYRMQKDVAVENLKIEKHLLLPGLFLGYLNQGTANDDAAYRMKFGVSLPLFFWNNTASINAAKYEINIADNNINLSSFNLNKEYLKIVSDWLKEREMLDYYHQTGLIQSSEIEKSAMESYKAGVIGYYAFLQNIEQVYIIEFGYLDAMKNYNTKLIGLNYITGQYLK